MSRLSIEIKAHQNLACKKQEAQPLDSEPLTSMKRLKIVSREKRVSLKNDKHRKLETARLRSEMMWEKSTRLGKTQ